MFEMRHATIADAQAVRELLERAHAADGRPALSEFKELRVPVANAVRTLLAERDDPPAVQALAVAAWHPLEIGEDDGYWAAEIALDPPVRSPAAYAQVMAALCRDLGRCPSWWTFDEMQRAAAAEAGLVAKRTIVEMRRPLPAQSPQFPGGLAIKRFRVSEDEGRWLALNQRVFSHHPEAGAIDNADLALRMAQPWFDPNGLLILEEHGDPIGYCWTKLHSPDVGEIYMIGFVPERRGRGLARQLTLAGLAHLHEVGARTAFLYAEESNETAVGLYGSMGFAVARRVALYEPASE